MDSASSRRIYPPDCTASSMPSFPHSWRMGHCPQPWSLWDRLLAERPVVAIGGSDAHALKMRLGVIAATVFPYDYHFRAVNTHVLLEDPLSGDAARDAPRDLRRARGGPLLRRLRPAALHDADSASLRTGSNGETTMGGRMSDTGGASLQTWAPDSCEMRLLRDGRPLKTSAARPGPGPS